MDVKPLGMESDTLAKIVRERWSCRGFRPDPVPHDTIEQIVEIARATPSWCNTQPWHLHITEGVETERFRAALRAHVGSQFSEQPDLPFPAAYVGPYLERRRTSGWQLYDSLGIAKGDCTASGAQMLKNFDLFGAPHVAVVTTDAQLGLYAVHSRVFRTTGGPPGTARHIVRLPRRSASGQQLPHRTAEHRRDGHLARVRLTRSQHRLVRFVPDWPHVAPASTARHHAMHPWSPQDASP